MGAYTILGYNIDTRTLSCAPGGQLGSTRVWPHPWPHGSPRRWGAKLRCLQTLLGIGAANNSTVVFAIPLDLLPALARAAGRPRRRG